MSTPDPEFVYVPPTVVKTDYMVWYIKTNTSYVPYTGWEKMTSIGEFYNSYLSKNDYDILLRNVKNNSLLNTVFYYDWLNRYPLDSLIYQKATKMGIKYNQDMSINFFGYVIKGDVIKQPFIVPDTYYEYTSRHSNGGDGNGYFTKHSAYKTLYARYFNSNQIGVRYNGGSPLYYLFGKYITILGLTKLDTYSDGTTKKIKDYEYDPIIYPYRRRLNQIQIYKPTKLIKRF